MTLEEAIIHAEEVANTYEDMMDDYALDSKKLYKCANEYRQLAEWLRELWERQKQPGIIIRCKDCKHWKQQTNYKGVLLSFGFCESDDMWRSLYGETYEVSHIDTDDDFYCGYAERRTNGKIAR